MTIDLTRVAGRTCDLRLADWVRIVAKKHRTSPTGAGHGSSRFSSPSRSFTVLYAAASFRTAFAEAFIRDRLVGAPARVIFRDELDDLHVATLSSEPLHLVDLRGSAAYDLGVDTDAPRARDHHPGQIFSQAVHDGLPRLDGILYDSRLTAEPCVAVYERSLDKLYAAGHATPATRAPELHAELARLEIIVRPRRGV